MTEPAHGPFPRSGRKSCAPLVSSGQFTPVVLLAGSLARGTRGIRAHPHPRRRLRALDRLGERADLRRRPERRRGHRSRTTTASRSPTSAPATSRSSSRRPTSRPRPSRSSPRSSSDVFGTPGQYVADLLPTVPGDYTFQFAGSLHGETVDVTVTSGEDTFSPVQSSSDIEFPVKVPTLADVATRLDRIDGRIEALQAAVPAAGAIDARTPTRRGCARRSEPGGHHRRARRRCRPGRRRGRPVRGAGGPGGKGSRSA